MNKKVLSFVNKLEGYKTAIKELHWDADNMSQHELCDKIAESIAEFQDTVSEVEQSITGKLATGNLKPVSYKVTTLKKFVEDVLDATNTFYKSLEDEGDTYTGMRSDCESFLSDMQRNLYLVNFTMKEDLKRRLANRINEGFKKEENIKTTFHGTKPSTEKGLFKRINDLTKNGQLNTRTFGGVTDVLDFYRRILGNIGGLRSIDACEGNNYVVKLETEGGLTYFGLLRIKEVGEGQCKASITFSPHADVNDGVEPNETEPTIEDGTNYETIEDAEQMERPGDEPWKDFALDGDNPDVRRYKRLNHDQNPKIAIENKLYELQTEGRVIRMTGSELHNLIKESVKNLLEVNGSGMDDRAWSNMEDLRYDRADHLADMRDKVKAQNVSGQLSGLKNQIVDRYRQQARHNIKQAKRNYGNHTELWNKEMDNLTKVPKFRPGDRIVMYGFEGVPLTVRRIEGENYICTDDYGREVPIQISVQGSFTTV